MSSKANVLLVGSISNKIIHHQAISLYIREYVNPERNVH